MGVSEAVGGIYSKIEETFFGAMDFLADKGVPLYSVIDPIEERGVPFFPLAIASVLLVAFLACGLIFLSTNEASIRLSITDKTGAALSGVTISAFDGRTNKEIELQSSVFQDSQEFRVPIGKGGKIRLEASKNGYAPASLEVFLKDATVDAGIKLEKETKAVEGKVRLVDDETGDAVTNAKVVAKFSDNASVECLEGADG